MHKNLSIVGALLQNSVFGLKKRVVFRPPEKKLCCLVSKPPSPCNIVQINQYLLSHATPILTQMR